MLFISIIQNCKNCKHWDRSVKRKCTVVCTNYDCGWTGRRAVLARRCAKEHIDFDVSYEMIDKLVVGKVDFPNCPKCGAEVRFVTQKRHKV